MPARAPKHTPQKSAGPAHAFPDADRQARRTYRTGSKAWRSIRAQVLTDEMYRCRECGGYGDQVDHINADSSDNSRANLAVMCRACHSRKTAKEDGGFGNRRASRNP